MVTRPVPALVSHIPGDEGKPLPCELIYNPADPYAMTMHFPTQKTRWTFARSLLLATLETATPIGDGDMCVFFDADSDAMDVTFHATFPEGECFVVISESEAHAFAGATEVLVPLGKETCDVDSWLSRIFAEVKP